MEEIEGVFRPLTVATVSAAVNQGTEELIIATSGLSFILAEVDWRFIENPGDTNLAYIKGRLVQLLAVVDIADDTSVSDQLIALIEKNHEWLWILQLIDRAKEGRLPLALFNAKSVDLKRMQSHGLIINESKSVRFGPRGPHALEAIRRNPN